MPKKFERKRTWGKYLTSEGQALRAKWMGFLDEKEEGRLEMQSYHNDVRAMTPCFYVSNERASLGLSRTICTKSVASVILEIGRTKERPQQWPWWDGSGYTYEAWKKLG